MCATILVTETQLQQSSISSDPSENGIRCKMSDPKEIWNEETTIRWKETWTLPASEEFTDGSRTEHQNRDGPNREGKKGEGKKEERNGGRNSKRNLEQEFDWNFNQS